MFRIKINESLLQMLPDIFRNDRSYLKLQMEKYKAKYGLSTKIVFTEMSITSPGMYEPVNDEILLIDKNWYNIRDMMRILLHEIAHAIRVKKNVVSGYGIFLDKTINIELAAEKFANKQMNLYYSNLKIHRPEFMYNIKNYTTMNFYKPTQRLPRKIRVIENKYRKTRNSLYWYKVKSNCGVMSRAFYKCKSHIGKFKIQRTL